MNNAIATALARTQKNIIQIAQQYSRDPQEIMLLAVSKTQPAMAIQQAFLSGQRCFGENYLQEALDKIEALKELPIEWHFIGHIQTNKTRAIAEHFHWVHSVDRFKVAQRLSEQRPRHLPPLRICLEVNVDQESSKSGIPLKESLPLIEQITQLPNLSLCGLMAIPAPRETLEAQRGAFRILRKTLESANQTLGLGLKTLSMGMSGDLEAAIAEGATIVRIGTAIFGHRH